MNNRIYGPMIYRPSDSNHKFDTRRGIKIDTNTDDFLAILDEMAFKYGVSCAELIEALKYVNITDLNGLRFVQR